jgi:hypothetical protein
MCNDVSGQIDSFIPPDGPVCSKVVLMTPDMFTNTDLTPFYVILTLVCVVAFIFAAMNSR